uniref:TPS4_1 n=1 Tax=Erythropodium caribaeorum TaxID=86550 RepID=A0A8T9VVV6_9CNID|nr:TPS4_1 [Erythropodium caribaeorum]
MMSCSKELRMPREWTKYHHDILNEVVDQALFDEKELTDWLIACGLGKQCSTYQRYAAAINPYHFVRCLAVQIENRISKKIISRTQYYLVGTYMVDDTAESACSTMELLQMYDAYIKLDAYCFEEFPRLRSLDEMKQFLRRNETVNVEEKSIGYLNVLMDHINISARLLLHEGLFTKEDVLEYTSRLSYRHAATLRGFAQESANSAITDTIAETLWRRTMAGGVYCILPILEITSGAMGKIEAQKTLVGEMYVLSAVFCMLVNDWYSYYKEKAENKGERKMRNLLRKMMEDAQLSQVVDVLPKISEMMNEIVRIMYRKMETTKSAYPESPELHKLMYQIAMATAGWYFIHDKACPRYKDTPKEWRCTLVEVDEPELQEWRENDEKSSELLQQFLYNSSSKAKEYIDDISVEKMKRENLQPK